MPITKTVVTDDEKPSGCHQCMGGKLSNQNIWEVKSGDYLNPGIGDACSTDWAWETWDCENCGEVIGLSYALNSDPKDNLILFDGCHKSEREQFVKMVSKNHKVFGVECFDVTHDNPVSTPRFQQRNYRMFAQYTFGPYKTREILFEAVNEFVGFIHKEVRPGWITYQYTHPAISPYWSLIDWHPNSRDIPLLKRLLASDLIAPASSNADIRKAIAEIELQVLPQPEGKNIALA